MYRIDLASRAQRELRRLPQNQRTRIRTAIAGLASNPRPNDSLKLRGLLHRVRAGPYRIIYAVSDREQLVVVVKVARREKDTYDLI